MSKKHKILLSIISLAPFFLLLNTYAKQHPQTVESLYSSEINKSFIQIISRISGIFPFSLFELIVMISICISIYYLIRFFMTIKKMQSSPFHLILDVVLTILSIISLFYVTFLLCWGFNYTRVPLHQTMGLSISTYPKQDLVALYDDLIQLSNTHRELVSENTEGLFTYPGTYREIFKHAPLGYQVASQTYPILAGTYGEAKPIRLSKLMNYTMITGIYSPFTGEANVNVSVPDITLLFTTMHEMAHQRGFASEDEANFIAYLTCISHPDVHFRYAGYLTALSYVNAALANVDLDLLKDLNTKLSPSVLQDMRYKSDFWKTYETPVETVSTSINNTYLKLNGVNDGVKSYGRMVDLLLAFHEHKN